MPCKPIGGLRLAHAAPPRTSRIAAECDNQVRPSRIAAECDNQVRSSRVAAVWESPARQCRETRAEQDESRRDDTMNRVPPGALLVIRPLCLIFVLSGSPYAPHPPLDPRLHSFKNLHLVALPDAGFYRLLVRAPVHPN